ncbi:MAG: universal stress protein [Saprospiraceae bacterium]|jgi:nucleotide-binding universal stress UspA family protein|nr:universal stress protein [Saprospiraceae bacterium]
MILIATDFSQGAMHAMLVGMELALQSDSRVLLVHAYKLHSRAGMFLSLEEHIKKSAEQDMQEFVGKIPDRYLTCLEDSRVIQGYPEDVIRRLESQEQIGLVVIGTQGDSALREIFMGQTASALLNKMKCPVLAVPKDALIEPPAGLIMAWDGAHLDRQQSELLIEWAEKMKTTLQVVHVRTDKNSVPDADSADYFHQHHIPVNYIPGEGDIKDELDEYLQARPFTWLTLIKRDRGFFEPLFHDSIVRREIFTTTCPILII